MTGTHALVLGCSVGAGGASARALASAGLSIIGLHRGNHGESADELRQHCLEAGVDCVLIEGDAGRLKNIEALLAQVAAALGDARLHLVVHALADASAGLLFHPEGRAQLHPKQILKTFEIMSHSFLWWGQGLMGAGLMGTSSSIWGLPNCMDILTARGFGAIGPSKAALVGYIHFMASEFGRHGVRVNGIRFGATPTPAFQRMPNYKEALQTAEQVNPMGRHTRAEDVGNFLALMADPRAAWINGAVVDLDGGEVRNIGDAMFGLDL
jgi:enoyl-[acyl-carrier protein] reductase III